METTDTWVTTEYLKYSTGKPNPHKHRTLGLLSLVMSDSSALPEERQRTFLLANCQKGLTTKSRTNSKMRQLHSSTQRIARAEPLCYEHKPWRLSPAEVTQRTWLQVVFWGASNSLSMWEHITKWSSLHSACVKSFSYQFTPYWVPVRFSSAHHYSGLITGNWCPHEQLEG